MPDLFLNQIQIKSSTYSIYDSRLTENNGAIVAAEPVYIGANTDANALQTASQVASAIESAMSSVATDRITSGSAYLDIYSSATIHLGDGQNEVTVARLTSTGTLAIGGGAVEINDSNSTFKFADIVSTLDGGEGNITKIGETNPVTHTEGAGIVVDGTLGGQESVTIAAFYTTDGGGYEKGKAIYVDTESAKIGTMEGSSQWSYQNIATEPFVQSAISTSLSAYALASNVAASFSTVNSSISTISSAVANINTALSSYATQSYVSTAIESALTSTMNYKGQISSAVVPEGGALVGDVYVASVAIPAVNAEIGDMIIFNTDVPAGDSIVSVVDVIQKNIDGAVTSTGGTDNFIAIFTGSGSTRAITNAPMTFNSDGELVFSEYGTLGSRGFEMGSTTINGEHVATLSVTTSTINGVALPAAESIAFTDTTYNAGTGLSLSGTTFSLKVAGSEIGGLKTGYVESGNNFALKLSNQAGFVTVPTFSGATASTDGIIGLVPQATSSQAGLYLRGDGTWAAPSFEVGVATSTALGGIKIGYSESGTNYAVKLDAAQQAFVTVPAFEASIFGNTLIL